MMLREIDALERTVHAYPDDASLWALPPGLPNPGGTLALHLAGNLQHYVGAVLGRTGYVRDREAEFARRAVSRPDLIAEIDAARRTVRSVLGGLDEAELDDTFGEPMRGAELSVRDALLHLAAHLAYHLGQLDYHRRLVTGDSTGIDAISPARLADSG